MSVDWIGLDELVSRFTKNKVFIVESNLAAVTREILAAIQNNTPVLHGELIRSLFSRHAALLAYEIVEGAAHGIWVRKGTRAHPIFPVKKKALWWPGIAGGRPVSNVFHPGTKANPYSDEAVTAWQAAAAPSMQKILDDITISLVG